MGITILIELGFYTSYLSHRWYSGLDLLLPGVRLIMELILISLMAGLFSLRGRKRILHFLEAVALAIWSGPF